MDTSWIGDPEVADVEPTTLLAAAATWPAASETFVEAVLAADLIASVTEALSPCSLDSMRSPPALCDAVVLASDDAAIELSPCCASVSRSAVASNWVSSPLAHRFWKTSCDVLGLQIRDWNEVSVVMGRDLVEIELAEEERTRNAAFRRQSLCQLLATFYTGCGFRHSHDCYK